jgi:hypothetical protein
MTSQDFIRRYENNELSETLAFDEWVGDYHLLTRLLEKAEILRGIRFAD